jgi:signal recognition particle receptor subunit beta
MALLNHVTREITAKVVYYGPGLCGKTSNLKYIYDNLEEEGRGNMLSLATEADRTLFFDFLPMDLGTMRGFKVRLQLYTVPGQVFYEETRRRVLKGCDGVVLVADSQRSMQEANRESLAQLRQHLSENGLVFAEVPLVLQYNKRDLPDLLSVEEMDADLNPANVPFFEAVANEGIGVEDTLKASIRLVLKKLVDKALGVREAGSGIWEEREPAKVLSQDTSPGFFPAPLEQQEGAEAESALFGDNTSELVVGLETDPFTEPEVLETASASGLPASAPRGTLQSAAPEWLFSEPGDDTASLLAVATPIEDAVTPREDLPDELFKDTEGSPEPDALPEIPALEGDEIIAALAQESDEDYELAGAIPKLHMAMGQVKKIDLVIAGRTYRLKIQLETID